MLSVFLVTLLYHAFGFWPLAEIPVSCHVNAMITKLTVLPSHKRSATTRVRICNYCVPHGYCYVDTKLGTPISVGRKKMRKKKYTANF